MSKKRTLTMVFSAPVGRRAGWCLALRPRKSPGKRAGDPAAALGKPTGQDTFDSANNWTCSLVGASKSEIKNGQYVMTAKGSKDYSCWEVTWPLLQDFYLEVQATTP